MGSPMIVCIGSYKGGIGKTTTAIHIAAYLQTLAPTILADGDIVRASGKWALRSDGKGLPFTVVPIGQLAKHVRQSIPRRIRQTRISKTPPRAAICW